MLIGVSVDPCPKSAGRPAASLPRARLLEKLGDLFAAEGEYRRLVARGFDLEVRVRYARLLVAIDEPVAAHTCLRRGLIEAAWRPHGLVGSWRWIPAAYREMRELERRLNRDDDGKAAGDDGHTAGMAGELR